MSLATGTKLGPYEIGSQLGKGGMGEVYRACDTKLKREVALKVVPEAFARDAERMGRFEHEARMLAALNHPNIASIYGLEDSPGGIRALVMELVPGPTLTDRIAARPLSLLEALPIMKQIAEALEYAHEHGIIHRDLKPANVKLTNDGAVKVLDFGLAKVLEGDPDQADVLTSSTISLGASTRAGTILGTAAYMSPEQARGKPLDKRTDIWSFGCVLYEALTGCKPFTGETVTDTLAAVLERDPDWSALPSSTPKNIRVLLQRCLQKDPKQRQHDIADARIEIEETLRQPEKDAAAEISARPARKGWLLPAVALTGILAGAILAWGIMRMARSAEADVPHLARVARLTHDPDYSQSPTWSPDGTMLAFSSNRSGNYEIYVRRVEGGQEVNVTNDPGQDIQPDFSPDGNWIAFVSTRSSRTGLIQIGTLFGSEFRTYGGDIWLVPALGGRLACWQGTEIIPYGIQGETKCCTWAGRRTIAHSWKSPRMAHRREPCFPVNHRTGKFSGRDMPPAGNGSALRPMNAIYSLCLPVAASRANCLMAPVTCGTLPGGASITALQNLPAAPACYRLTLTRALETLREVLNPQG